MISQDRVDCEFPILHENDLFLAIQERKHNAAGGMDGWRTCEMQSLPPEAFRPWAMLWNRVEAGELCMPSIFKAARLVMLPKPGAKSNQPIDRRLITLLNIPYLMYTRARFKQSIPWQLQTFPANVCGGVPGRDSAQISHKIAAECEVSILKNEGLIGIKLDRSKCFDRVAPTIIYHLGAAMGLDAKFLRTWLQTYEGFARHICLGPYIDSTPLVNENGIAQGDCASVLAINILMTAWSKILAQFDLIKSWIYIDDAYIYARLEGVDQMQLAIRATELFDKLVGQQLNLQKSSGWTTAKQAAVVFADAFPQIPISEFFEVLGTSIKTGKRSRVIDDTSKAHIIRTTIGEVGRLPIDLQKKAFLIGAKAISKLLFMPELVPWPKITIDNLVKTVTKALWGKRPQWRSTELLFAHFTNPICAHPRLAIDARIVINIVTRCRRDPVFYDFWCQLCRLGRPIARGILDNFVKACGNLKLGFFNPNILKFLGITFDFFQLSPKCIRRICRAAACQSLYSEAIAGKRLDLFNWGSGVVDVELAPLRARREPWSFGAGVDEAIIPGPVTGCLQTADRLHNAGLVNSPLCR